MMFPWCTEQLSCTDLEGERSGIVLAGYRARCATAFKSHLCSDSTKEEQPGCYLPCARENDRGDNLSKSQNMLVPALKGQLLTH